MEVREENYADGKLQNQTTQHLCCCKDSDALSVPAANVCDQRKQPTTFRDAYGTWVLKQSNAKALLTSVFSVPQCKAHTNSRRAQAEAQTWCTSPTPPVGWNKGCPHFRDSYKWYEDADCEGSQVWRRFDGRARDGCTIDGTRFPDKERTYGENVCKWDVPYSSCYNVEVDPTIGVCIEEIHQKIERAWCMLPGCVGQVKKRECPTSHHECKCISACN